MPILCRPGVGVRRSSAVGRNWGLVDTDTLLLHIQLVARAEAQGCDAVAVNPDQVQAVCCDFNRDPLHGTPVARLCRIKPRSRPPLRQATTRNNVFIGARNYSFRINRLRRGPGEFSSEFTAGSGAIAESGPSFRPQVHAVRQPEAQVPSSLSAPSPYAPMGTAGTSG